MRIGEDARVYLRAATHVRNKVSTLFDARPAQSVILAPGSLIALRVLGPPLGMVSVLATNEEYYNSSHFPSMKFHQVTPGRILGATSELRPSAVIMSLVTWRGHTLPVADVFRKIRASMGQQCPILICDYTHGGAIGFPSVDRLHADVVCGDMGKWLTPMTLDCKLSFVWFRSRRFHRIAARELGQFFLAIDREPDSFSTRWLDPAHVVDCARWLRRATRAQLIEQHHSNLTLACAIAKRLRLPPPTSSILWLQGSPRADPLLCKMKDLGLVWSISGAGDRVTCRSDVLQIQGKQLRKWLHWRVDAR